MGDYTPTTFSAGSAVTASDLNTELNAIATAVNDMTSANFPTASRYIPNEAMNLPNAAFFNTIHIPTVAGAKTTADIIAYMVVPFACTLKNVRYIADDVTDAVSTVAIYLNGTINQSATTLAADDTAYSVTSFTDSSLDAGDIISIRCVVAGGQTITSLSATMAFYAQHCLTTLPV